MPHYHILERKNKATFISCGIIMARSVRSAWGAYKKLNKKNPKEHPINKKLEYHVYPINHSRFWKLKDGKWEIDSFFGNHDAKKYREKQRRMYNKLHKQRQFNHQIK
jgi:predicted phosphohydrolase